MGPTGPQGPKGDSGLPAVAGTSAVYSPQLQPAFVGVIQPNPATNFSGATLFSATNLSSNSFSTNTANVTTLAVSGNTTITGSLNVIGAVTIPGFNSGTVTNGVYTNVANSMSLINPLTTLAESWIGPSSTTGIYFKSGNVGIGTTSPSALLTVGTSGTGAALDGNEVFQFAKSGNMYGTIRDGTNVTYLGQLSTEGFIGTQTALPFSIKTSAADRLTILSGGNVGIGTTSPVAKLQISNPAQSTNNLLSLSGARTYTFQSIDELGGSRDLLLSGGDGPYNYLYFSRTGNVGVGTTSPSQKLFVNGNIYGTTINGKLRDFVSVKDYGATGDGVTDDTVSITNAIVANPKATIYFPCGNYVISSFIVNTAVTLQGAGICTKLSYLSSSGTAITFNYPIDLNAGAGLRDMYIRGPGFTTAAVAVSLGIIGDAVPVTGAMGVLISNVSIREFGLALKFGNHTWSTKVDHSFFIDNGQHVLNDDDSADTGESISFDSCVFGNNGVFRANSVYLNRNSTEAYFYGGSFDNSQLVIDNGKVHVSQTNFENPGTNSAIPFILQTGGDVALTGINISQDETGVASQTELIKLTGGALNMVGLSAVSVASAPIDTIVRVFNNTRLSESGTLSYTNINNIFIKDSSFSGRLYSIGNSSNISTFGGDVGIGTITPQTRLHIYHSAANAVFSIENTGNGNTSGIDFVRQRSTGAGIPGGSMFINSDTTSNNALLYIQAQNSSAYSGTTGALAANNGARMILRGGTGIISFENGASESVRFTANGNVGIGTITPHALLSLGGGAARSTTEGTNRLDIFDGTAPVGTLANGISIYSSAGEAYIMDAAGNATLQSPHDLNTNYWVFDSKNAVKNTSLVIDMEQMMKQLNVAMGWDYVHETLNGVTLSTTPIPLNLPDTFFSAITTRITTWLADAGNGIGKIFVGEVNTNKLCVKKTDGTDVCVTGDQLDALLASPPSQGGVPASSGGGGNPATCSDGIQNQDETGVDTGGVCTPTVLVTLESIAITTPATKLSYTVGDTLDITDLAITGTYSDATTQVETITDSNITGFDSGTAVTGQVLTITVGEKITTYTIDVIK